MPRRRDKTDRAGLNTEAVAAVQAARLVQARCQGWIADEAGRRRCNVLMDPVLTEAGFRSHPNCDPGEVSELWPPLEWPESLFAGQKVAAKGPARARR